MSRPVVGFCGMTHLGLNSAAASAARGFQVICYDKEEKLVQQLSAGNLPVVEPNLEEYCSRYSQQISFSSQLSDLADCNIVYISVDVPTDDKGNSELRDIEYLLEDVAGILNEDCVLVVLSQVPPGFTRKYLKNKQLLYYQVETLIFGKAIERAEHPERFIIGCENPDETLPVLWLRYLESFNCPILPMRYESAELAKISINMCLVTSVCMANSMAEICEVTGADWKEIVPALRLDKRIGEYSYIEPGLGISGGNLERDIASVLKISENHQTDSGLFKAWIHNSQYRKEWPFRVLAENLLSKKPDARIAILGLAYKENTNSVKNSPAIRLIEQLAGHVINVYDPVVKTNLPDNVETHSNPDAAMKDADVVIIMTAWSEFRNISCEQIVAAMAGSLVIDPYRILDHTSMQKAGLIHFVLGSREV